MGHFWPFSRKGVKMGEITQKLVILPKVCVCDAFSRFPRFWAPRNAGPGPLVSKMNVRDSPPGRHPPKMNVRGFPPGRHPPNPKDACSQ